MNFDILNIDSWENVKDENLVYKNKIIYTPETGQPTKAKDFIEFMNTIFSFAKKNNSVLNNEDKKKLVEKFLSRIENTEKPKDLTPETEDKTESGFNPYNESTWNLASERRIMRAKGVLVYSTGKDKTIVYTSESQWCGMMKYKFVLGEKQGQSRETIIKKDLDFNYMFCNPKDLEPVYIINGFSFSKALCDTAISTEKSRLEKIADAMNYCKKNNLKKHQYKQYLFSNFIPADKEFFIEVYFAEQYKLRKDVDDLIVSFYCGYEPESEEELDAIIKNSMYLQAHKDLIPIVKDNFEFDN